MFKMYTFYEMYAICNVFAYNCIPHFDKTLYRFCIQNVFMQNVYHIWTNSYM